MFPRRRTTRHALLASLWVTLAAGGPGCLQQDRIDHPLDDGGLTSDLDPTGPDDSGMAGPGDADGGSSDGHAPDGGCLPGGGRSCSCQDGRVGQQGCSDFTWGLCLCAEICPELAERPCPGGATQGTCSPGIQRCTAGHWGECAGRVEPTAELCDGLDNDCDGETDEDFALGEPCTVGEGACQLTGRTECTPQGEAGCQAEGSEAFRERCDDQDNDCDGLIDEEGVCGPLPPLICDGRLEELDLDRALIVPAGETCEMAGQYRFREVYVAGRVHVVAWDRLRGGVLDLRSDGLLTITEGATVDASASGYPDEQGPGAPPPDEPPEWIQPGPPVCSGSGGSYGGAGGISGHSPEPVRGALYGTDSGPDIDMGSGGSDGCGGAVDVVGGRGGGSISLQGAVVVMAGDLLADGQTPPRSHTWAPGGGSGGGILVQGLERVDVPGRLSAMGGDGLDGNWEGGGGGGGRIKLLAPAGSFTGVHRLLGGGAPGTGGFTGMPGDPGTFHCSFCAR